MRSSRVFLICVSAMFGIVLGLAMGDSSPWAWLAVPPMAVLYGFLLASFGMASAREAVERGAA